MASSFSFESPASALSPDLDVLGNGLISLSGLGFASPSLDPEMIVVWGSEVEVFIVDLIGLESVEGEADLPSRGSCQCLNSILYTFSISESEALI